MNNLYTVPWGYDDKVPFYQKKPCNCENRSKEQQEIDEKQNQEIKAEIERSQTIDTEQSVKIEELNTKIDNFDSTHYYETDE